MYKIVEILNYSNVIRTCNEKNKEYYLIKMFQCINDLLKKSNVFSIAYELERYKESHKEDFDLIYRFLMDVFIQKNIVYLYNKDISEDDSSYIFNFYFSTNSLKTGLLKKDLLKHDDCSINDLKQMFDFIYKKAISMADFIVSHSFVNNKIYVNLSKFNILDIDMHFIRFSIEILFMFSIDCLGLNKNNFLTEKMFKYKLMDNYLNLISEK